MARKSTDTKEKLLDAFETLLERHGTSGATLDAVAAEAGVSKGGLLYHFGSKAELVKGSLDRLRVLVSEDIEEMKAAEAGPHIFYLETSAEIGTPLDRSLVAASRLSHEYDEARETLRDIRNAWLEVINDHLGDIHLAHTIQLIGDGLYLKESVGLSAEEAVEHVKNVLARLGL